MPPASSSPPLKRARKFIIKGCPCGMSSERGISTHGFVYTNLQLCQALHVALTGGSGSLGKRTAACPSSFVAFFLHFCHITQVPGVLGNPLALLCMQGRERRTFLSLLKHPNSRTQGHSPLLIKKALFLFQNLNHSTFPPLKFLWHPHFQFETFHSW